MGAALNNALSSLLKKAHVTRMIAVVLLLVFCGTSAGPIPATSSDFPKQTPLEVLMNSRTLTLRLHEKATAAYDAFIEDEFKGNFGYCAEQITWEELIDIRMTTIEWRAMEDEERLQRLRRDLQVFGLYLQEVKLDELDKDGHTDTADTVEATIHQLNGLMTAIAVTNNVLGFTSSDDVSEIMSTTLQDPPGEYARSIRDCVVLREFKSLVYRVHRDFTILTAKYRR
uniref:Ciliary neurotrophic factor n=1 Tax=Branchiostoma floridae TaxID=7739 RepID=C3ZTN3_BRAFL|eukprot:XP_002588129.1 hypothetical protein BRAFLDRAFT_124954 [Branchiostoma floridae]